MLDQIIPNGTTVKTKIGNIDALIVGVEIHGIPPNLSISYRISYFIHGERKTPWVESYEIEVKKPAQQAGFRTTNANTLNP